MSDILSYLTYTAPYDECDPLVMNEQSLNLARKWRSQTFDQIVGQELSVRILKNSLYRGQFFPVYLFSGQRGCGKTTTARVFAAALNCDQLSSFQKSPQNVVLPCLQCTSCCAFFEGKHPDFIEIDAASHTGVDNVRMIIDAASLMPLMGRKKIYLIDEAHMLSKAASNALLKILEEPPRSVVFILATTDQQKIIETVRSRCFTLLFKSLDQLALTRHLQTMCETEGIAYDLPGLEYIVQETEGSARDAINVLEQVRFASNMVNKPAVLQVMGHVDESRIISLSNHLLAQDHKKLFVLYADLQKTKCVPEFIWMSLLELLRELLWIKHNLSTGRFASYDVLIKDLAHRYSLGQIVKVLNTLYTNEEMFKKTTAQHAFLEFLFLTLCKSSKSSSEDGGTIPCAQPAFSADSTDDECDEDAEDEEEINEDDEDCKEPSVTDSWQTFLHLLDQCNEPLLGSVFKQSKALSVENSLNIEIPQQMAFFQDVIEQGRAVWHPLLEQLYGNIKIAYQFTHVSLQSTPKVNTASITTDIKPAIVSHISKQPVTSYSKKTIAVQSSRALTYASSDPVWKKTALIMKYFPGELIELGAAHD